MSADNFVAIVYDEKENMFTGYHCFASRDYRKITDYVKFGTKIFETDNMREAVVLSQKEGCEYGFTFINLPQDITPRVVSKHYVLDNGEACSCEDCNGKN